MHVYFSEEDIPRDADREQLAALDQFKKELEEQGLLGSYSDPADLAGQVIRAIESDIEEEGWGEERRPTPTAASGADLRWEHIHESEPRTDSKGRTKMRARRNDLVVTNSGDPANDLTFAVEPVGGTEFFIPEPPTEPVTLHRNSSLSWILIPRPGFGSAGRAVRVTAQWTESGEPKTGEWTVTLQ